MAEVLDKKKILMIFRILLKKINIYPSSKKADLRSSIIEEFHLNKNLHDKKRIKEEISKAKIGMHHLNYYEELHDNIINKKISKINIGFEREKTADINEFTYF